MASDIIVVERCLLKSKPFRELSGTAKTMYFDFLLKCKISKTKARPGRKAERIITNNGEIVYPYAEAQQKGISPGGFQRGLDSLIAAGFIDIAHLGSGGRKGDMNRYSISERWRKYGQPDFVNRKRAKDKREGRGFAEVWRRRKVQASIRLV